MAHELYEVPIIHQDLRQEDTIVQIAEAFDYLDACVNDICRKIETKLSQTTSIVQNLQTRTLAARSKVKKLKGSKKATKVIATAKYPSTDVYKDYESIFNHHEPSSLNRQTTKLKSKFPPVEKKVLQEKLQFYHVKASNKLMRRNVEIALEEGLGSLPNNINSITSLLLFNTSENPYKQYVMLDPLGTVGKMKQTTEDDYDNIKMEAAPLSISQKEQVKRPTGENYFYSPGLGDVPQLDVPMDLPDLPGIADDLRYSMDSGPMIAPSVTHSSNVVAAPPVASTLQSLFIDDSTPATFIPPVVTVPIPPVEKAIVAQIPPPPPPPPPSITQEVSKSKKSSTPPPKMKVAPDGDMRANLMEAIRQAGGSGSAKLRSLSERKTEAKKKKQEQKASTATGGDLMADLHAKLSLRRKGISGANKTETVASAMEKVSAMIPPPPRPEQSQVSGTEDESDWES